MIRDDSVQSFFTDAGNIQLSQEMEQTPDKEQYVAADVSQSKTLHSHLIVSPVVLEEVTVVDDWMVSGVK